MQLAYIRPTSIQIKHRRVFESVVVKLGRQMTNWSRDLWSLKLVCTDRERRKSLLYYPNGLLGTISIFCKVAVEVLLVIHQKKSIKRTKTIWHCFSALFLTLFAMVCSVWLYLLLLLLLPLMRYFHIVCGVFDFFSAWQIVLGLSLLFS